jgi:pyrimidine deaminase RibD-like protein
MAVGLSTREYGEGYGTTTDRSARGNRRTVVSSCSGIHISDHHMKAPKSKKNVADVEYIELALAEAAKCVGEDERTHPKVGAVAVRSGEVLAVAYRGELEPGDHAEFTALEKKLGGDSLAGATIYTTLEPCTTRSHPKVPCAQRLVERRVRRVVIGMLDPRRWRPYPRDGQPGAVVPEVRLLQRG